MNLSSLIPIILLSPMLLSGAVQATAPQDTFSSIIQPYAKDKYKQTQLFIDLPKQLIANKPYKPLVRQYNRALKLNKLDAETYLKRAILYTSQKGYRRAIRDYKAAIKLVPNHSMAHTIAGYIYFRYGQYQFSRTALDKAIFHDRNNAFAYEIRGALFAHLKKYIRAIEDLNTAIELNPQLIGAYINRGLAYTEKSDHEYLKAIDNYNKALELEPNNMVARYNRGIAYNRFGKSEKAATINQGFKP